MMAVILASAIVAEARSIQDAWDTTISFSNKASV